uniref:Reverse transcriptase domain-containing protein n=1 Tax=Oncorhynchus mykiss TaxID=8022 RepID=A0A8K9WVL4_ONCMY
MKAFDTVNHEILITKLSKFNFSPGALRWMKSYLEGRTQCVRVSNELSPTLISMGVPQGSILGPTLFSVYINDVSHAAGDSLIHLYHSFRACEVWKPFVAFMNFVSLLFVLCCSVCMLHLACPMLLCLNAMSCFSYVALRVLTAQ